MFTQSQIASSRAKHVYCISNQIKSNDKCLLKIKQYPVIHVFTIKWDKVKKNRRLPSIKRHKVKKKHVCYPSNETKSQKTCLLRIKQHPVTENAFTIDQMAQRRCVYRPSKDIKSKKKQRLLSIKRHKVQKICLLSVKRNKVKKNSFNY